MPPRLDYSNGRICTQCNQHKEQGDFWWKDGKQRLSSRCRECRNANYKENPHRARERARIWYKANSGRASVRSRYYRKANVCVMLLRAAKRRARNSALPFDLTITDIHIPQRCPVLGLSLVVNEGRSRASSPTIDRIVPSLGYVRGNILVISHRANTIKNDASVEELFRVARFYENLEIQRQAATVGRKAVDALR